MHEVLVNRLGGLSLPRKSVVRLTDRPDMTLDVYRGRKTTIQQQFQSEYSQTQIWDLIESVSEGFPTYSGLKADVSCQVVGKPNKITPKAGLQRIVGRKTPRNRLNQVPDPTLRVKRDSTKRRHQRHYQRQPGEQLFPIQVVNG